jgi:hypothetical protein
MVRTVTQKRPDLNQAVTGAWFVGVKRGITLQMVIINAPVLGALVGGTVGLVGWAVERAISRRT